MGHLVRLVVGCWERGSQGMWRFNRDTTEVKYDVVIRENESYDSVVEMVRVKYKLHQILRPSAPVLLTYELHELMKEPGEYTIPPLEVRDDNDVEVFMAMKLDCAWLELYVTYESIDLENYSRYRAQENILEPPYGFANPAKPIPWRGLRTKGVLVVTEDMLMDICTPEEMNMLERASDRLKKKLVVGDPDESESGSSASGNASPVGVDEGMKETNCGIISLGGIDQLENPFAGYQSGIPTDTEDGVGYVACGVSQTHDHGGGVIRDLNMEFELSTQEPQAPERTVVEPDDDSDDYQLLGSTVKRVDKGKGIATDEVEVYKNEMSWEWGGTAKQTKYGEGDGTIPLLLGNPVSNLSGTEMVQHGGGGSQGGGLRHLSGLLLEAGDATVKDSYFRNNPIEDEKYDVDGNLSEGGGEAINGKVFVGQIFEDKEAFKTHMALYAIGNKFRYLVKKSEPGKMIMACVGAMCKWRVYATKIGGTPKFEIKTYEGRHNCTVDERWGFRNHATSKIIGNMMRGEFMGGGGGGPRLGMIRDVMRNTHRVPVSYWKAWKARESGNGQEGGNDEKSFAKLPSYLEQLAIENPGSLISLEMTPAPNGAVKFKYLFISLESSIKGYTYMRKVIILDGTHLKGKYGGCLLTASAQDGNYQIYPLAFEIVDSENDHSWTWFFNKLKGFVEDTDELVFVTDRHTSIYSSVRKVYPRAQQCACLLHLQRNVQSIFKKKHLLYLISRAARAYRVEDFYIHFNEIKTLDIACADYMIRVGLEHWARSHFNGARYNIMTSNLVESLNQVLTIARGYPIVALVEFIREKLMEWFSSRRSAANNNVSMLTPKIAATLSRNFAVSTGYAVRHIINAEYEVGDDCGLYHRVDLERRKCSCKEFEVMGIPCTHAVAASVNSEHSVEGMVQPVYSNLYWGLSYAGRINPVDLSKVNEEGGMKLLPPNARRPPGRPRKSRILSAGEIRIKGVFKRVRACSRCNGKDHNLATCKMPI